MLEWWRSGSEFCFHLHTKNGSLSLGFFPSLVNFLQTWGFSPSLRPVSLELRCDLLTGRAPGCVLHRPEEWGSQARNRAWCWATTAFSFPLILHTNWASLPLQLLSVWISESGVHRSELSELNKKGLAWKWVKKQPVSKGKLRKNYC